MVVAGEVVGRARAYGLAGELAGSETGRWMVDPFTEQSFAMIADDEALEVSDTVARAREQMGVWQRTSPADRRERMLWLGEAIGAAAFDLALLESVSVGKPLAEARVDVRKAREWVDYFAGWCERLDGRAVETSGGGGPFAYTRREPVGLVGAIVPWNYPLMIAMWKVAPALAAGCGVVLKASELTPLSGEWLDAACSALGLPVWTVNGGPEVGRELVSRVDKVSFTGSAETGRQVMTGAAGSPVPVTLELGGKSALIVCPDADERFAGELAADGILHNAGQACNAPARLLVPHDRVDTLAGVVAEALDRAVGGDPLADGTTLGPLVSETQALKVGAFLARAQDEGAMLLQSRVTPARPGWWVSPTVVVDVDPGSEIAQEEVFGPVITVLPYRDLEHAVRLANGTRYGLAAGVVTEDERQARQMARDLRAGHVYVNHWSTQDPAVPFGGRETSGVGEEHGPEGLAAYLTSKAVYLPG